MVKSYFTDVSELLRFYYVDSSFPFEDLDPKNEVHQLPYCQLNNVLNLLHGGQDVLLRLAVELGFSKVESKVVPSNN